MPLTIPQGSFVWYDLATSDPEGAKTFYQQITPWKPRPWEDANSYSMWMNEDTPIGGVLPLSDRVKARGLGPHWLPFVYVYDVDHVARQAAKLGGEVRMAPREIPHAGCWSVIADPQGATIGLFEAPETLPHRAGPPRRGDFTWHELSTSDYKAAFDFYCKLFKWEKTGESDMGEMGTYLMFGQKGIPYGGMFNRVEGMPAPSWLCYLRVDDINASADMVKTAGGTVHRGPHEVPGGDMIAICSDPQGAPFALHALAAT